MNTKRQTIWLVSMLSLMVVLSAYYLFTEDVNNLDFSAKGAVPKEVSINAGQLDSQSGAAATTNGAAGKAAAGASATGTTTGGATANGTAASGASAGGTAAGTPATGAAQSGAATGAAAAGADKAATTGGAAQEGAKAPAAATTSSGAKADTPSAAKPDAAGDKAAQPVSGKTAQASDADAKVLEKMQAKATSGADYFVNMQLVRDEQLSKQVEQLMTILADTKQTKEAAAKAQVDLQKLQDLEAKMTNLEDALAKDYSQAVITQESGKYKVTVQAKKLEKSQALSIADMTMKELGIGPENIAIQYLP